ncbi:RNA polymerase sigma factor [Amycolatopsis rhabdoformis]|uniref:RNA polymerase sigma factor n=1 Tax=Amycolatopsis rhabdoformis TaxID=1448059 RepID=A0ABZ1I432_9PSEU|nr:RNA polymerase sigma factor [Amycolatopsis rhabdoformis]WSE28701.1 RNA polymerase sigma factor [Amycolatopsis rhabdoformis]
MSVIDEAGGGPHPSEEGRPDLSGEPPGREFEDLFTRHAGELYRYLSRWVGAAADDLVADTFVAALKGRATYEPARATARAWLFGIATNLLHTHLRSKSRESTATGRLGSFVATDVESHERRVVERLVAEDDARALATALAALSADDRDVLLLTSWARLDSNEVAAALGIPVGTVRSRLHRVRRTLRVRRNHD